MASVVGSLVECIWASVFVVDGLEISTFVASFTALWLGGGTFDICVIARVSPAKML